MSSQGNTCRYYERPSFKEVERYKHLNQMLKEKAVKLFANSGYGTFAQAYFRDTTTFELLKLTTGFARAILQGLAEDVQE